MNEPVIFISYSHEDEVWRKELEKQLDVLQRLGILKVWTDRDILAGDNWRPKIDLALQNARVAIFLISVDFLRSDFILNEEVPRLLERRKREEVRIIPVIASPCPWKYVPWLKEMQVRPRDDNNLEKQPTVEWKQELLQIVAEVAKYLGSESGSDARAEQSERAVRPESSPEEFLRQRKQLEKQVSDAMKNDPEATRDLLHHLIATKSQTTSETAGDYRENLAKQAEVTTKTQSPGGGVSDKKDE